MVAGIVFKLNTLLVVLLAGMVTGLFSNMTPFQILEILGKAFVDNRFMAVFILIMPVIGLLERRGLREKAVSLIKKVKDANSGRIIFIYMLIRQVAASLGLQMDGHLSFVWPLIAPMAEAAAVKKISSPDQIILDRIRSMAAASENFGNSYGNLIFVGGGGLLLIKSVLEGAGYEVNLFKMALFAIPSGVAALIVCAGYFYLLDLWLQQKCDIDVGDKKDDNS